MAIAMMTALLGLALLTRAACSAWEARRREDLAEMNRYRDMACACETGDCARRVARLPAFSASPMSHAADRAQLDAWICLSRHSRSCTLRDLRKD